MAKGTTFYVEQLFEKELEGSNSMLNTIRVTDLEGDPLGANVLAEIRRVGFNGSYDAVRTAKVYRFEGADAHMMDLLARRIVDVNQTYRVDSPLIEDAAAFTEVAYKPGVMNPEAASLMKLAHDLGCDTVVAAGSSYEYHFYGTFDSEEVGAIVKRLLMNKTVQMQITEAPQTLLIDAKAGSITTVPIREATDEQLLSLSKDKLFLNLEEMQVIKTYFQKIGRDPIDAELETLAQTWSEHCGHKTFRAQLVVNGRKRLPLITRLKQVSAQYSTNVVSAFVDNSGVIGFYDGYAICGKVETHNSPSAIEPYGGAMTGSGGVFRDVADTAEGAKVIASTDILCFGPPDLPDEKLPLGCLRPDYILRRVVAGIGAYGNRMGIPTCNGSIRFHEDFRAKPTVIVGAYGILPEARAKKGEPKPGDLIVAIGGRTGRDGIHGATFSSAEMTERTASVNSSAVQIGNAIVEKCLFDVGLVMRDRGFVRAKTDCGAGGFASAIGEMGSCIGARVFLEKVPLKYQGLLPWEILLSESQERSVFAIRSEHLHEVHAICKDYNVEATVLGHFTDDHQFFVTYNDETVCDLSMEFLHNGLPQRVMHATYQRAKFKDPILPNYCEQDWIDRYLAVMGHLNVCSKEPIVRSYDHTVQGTSVLPPFTGVHQNGPCDAAVLRPLLDKPYGVVISHGLNPVLNRIDPYWGSVCAAVEALANLVAAGGSVCEGDVGLIDNFIWPFPDEESLGALDRSVDACVAVMQAFHLPFISGKDSLSGTYRGGNTVIKIPPVLCVSAFGRIKDVEKTMSSDFKFADSAIVLVGNPDPLSLGGSVLYDTLGFLGNRVPEPNLHLTADMFRKFQDLIASGAVLAVHDVSDGGMAATLAEMCIGGEVGADIDLFRAGAGRTRKHGDSRLALGVFYNEMPGCFLVEVPKSSHQKPLFEGMPHAVIGSTTSKNDIVLRWGSEKLMSVGVSALKNAWEKRMKEVFHHG